MNAEAVRSFPGFSGAKNQLRRDELGQPFFRKTGQGRVGLKLQAQGEWYNRHRGLRHIPAVRSAGWRGEEFLLELEYINGVTLSHWIHSKSAIKPAPFVFSQIVDAIGQSLHRPSVVTRLDLERDNYILDKLIAKVGEVRSRCVSVESLMHSPELTINGTRYLNFSKVMERLLNDKTKLNQLALCRPSPVHGDLTLQNIMITFDDFYFIDPNDENVLSTPLIDYAKLLQSLDSGYETLVQLDTQCFEVTPSTVNYRVPKDPQVQGLKELLLSRLKIRLYDWELKQLDFHQAVHLARLLPYQLAYNPLRVPLFYAEMIRKLNQFVDACP